VTTAVKADLTFQRETLSQMWDEALPLLQAHYQEIAHYQDIPFEPDLESYHVREVAGALRIFTVRTDWQYDLVGYAVFFVGLNSHYHSSLQALQDVLYVDPAHRGTTGLRLIRYCDEQLQAEGVQVTYQHQKLAHPALGIVLKRLGYEPVEQTWATRLDLPVDGKS
jgi:hypothetical protein